MLKGTKYNAFTGVFVPSLLTILGVIMYMRLGWVVGEAGLIGTIIIILIAHVISISTGLSISSIATDKKIKTGGIYYILSRSLGLPMGGAIGIALFIGTALSISLYIVGFSESFLSLDIVQQYTGLQADIMGFRIVGTIIISLLVVIAFISTSLAMRVQFFILLAIALSLLSIALGFFQHADTAPTHIFLFSKGDFSLEYVFAIFFPAVTGFTAGVAMSGDLKNPKKDIPKGTIWAIAVGFIIYVALAVGIAYFIDRETLTSDYNILTTIAWFSPLVVAGIWGATLSSALGGILGGPRILQAISQDKLTPKIFAKGYGEANEPRNALLLIFAIAEGGILIGKLDVIAGVVSMFYLASYGFVNLAYVLEKWASTDFRPSFRIPILVGVLGFVASFAIMFRLDPLSMFASLLIMGLLYFMLKRREIRSEYGDVWQSVWTSVIRKALEYMDKRSIEERNWKPNIILFSGGTKKRTHLLALGKALVGKYGILSNFDLYETKDAEVLFPKHKQALKAEDTEDLSVFTRRQSCADIYQGIETIARTYGFSGIEPNTILMGWGRETKNPKRFVQMLKTLSDLDYNLLLIDYDKDKGFGKKQQIDIWWKGIGNHGNLSLVLMRFLTAYEDWRNAKIRLLIVNNENNKIDLIRKKADLYLDSLRIDAEVKIINNEIEKKSFYDIVRVESQNTDLIFLGISEIEKDKEIEFIEKTNLLMHDIGTVVLVKASSLFKELNLGVSKESLVVSEEQKKVFPIKDVQLPSNVLLNNELKQVYEKLSHLFYQHLEHILNYGIEHHQETSELIKKTIISSLEQIAKQSKTLEENKLKQFVNQQRSKFLLKMNFQIQHLIDNVFPEHQNILQLNVENFIEQQNEFCQQLPSTIKLVYTAEDLKIKKEDSSVVKWYKQKAKIRLWFSKEIKYKLQFRKVLVSQYLPQRQDILYQYLKDFGLLSVQQLLESLKLVKKIDNAFSQIIVAISNKEDIETLTSNLQEESLSAFQDLTALIENLKQEIVQKQISFITNKINRTTNILEKVHPNSFIQDESVNLKLAQKINQKIQQAPNLWLRNQNIMSNASITEIRLLTLQGKLKNHIDKLLYETQELTRIQVIDNYQKTIDFLEQQIDNITENKWEYKSLNALAFVNETNAIYEDVFKLFSRDISHFPDTIELFEDETLNHFLQKQYENLESTHISVQHVLDYLIQNKLEDKIVHVFEEWTQKTAESISFLNDTARLISFSLENNLEKDIAKNNIVEILKEKRDKLQTELNYLSALNFEIEDQIQKIYTDASQLLSYYAFVKASSDIKHYNTKQSKAQKKSIWQKKNQLLSFIKNKKADLIYTQSRALGLKKQLENQDKIKSPVNSLLDFVYSVSPNKKVYQKLPFYYQQLFMSKHTYHRDFWVGRENEINLANTAIERYYAGYKGLLGVMGEPGSGKSFFAHYVSESFQKNLIHITPNITGERNLKSFEEALQKASGKNLSINQIFYELEEGSIIIIDDLELWCDKFDKNILLTDIWALIEKYYHKFLFVLVSNTFAFNSIITSEDKTNIFLQIISLKELSAKELKDIVLKRHQVGGLQSKEGFKNLTSISESKWAGIFLRFYKYTEGNINATFKLWLSSIKKIEDDVLFFQWPQSINVSLLEVINIDSSLVLSQLVIYKSLTQNELMVIMREKEKNIIEELSFLQRAGIIRKYKNRYAINIFVKPYIVKMLRNKTIL